MSRPFGEDYFGAAATELGQAPVLPVAPDIKTATKLQWALYLASRGFRVFPLRANTRRPAFSDYQHHATTDPDPIRAWWSLCDDGSPAQYNVGVLANDMVVVDVDRKNGKNGYLPYAEAGGHENTFVVYSPSGGAHYYFRYADSRNRTGLFGRESGVDIKSHNGLVVGPGSTIDGVPYVIANDAPMAELPAGFAALMQQPPDKTFRVLPEGVDLDNPNHLDMAVEYLKNSRPAIQGHAGDAGTYALACYIVRDLALSEETALDLMMRHWNDRCEPPWDQDELYAKVRNAARYANKQVGNATPEVMFAGVTPIPAPRMYEVIEPGLEVEIMPSGRRVFKRAEYILAADQKPRPWLAKGLLQRKTVVLLAAPGGTGKSLFTVNLAVHAIGSPRWGQFEFTKTPCNVAVYTREDDIEEFSPRMTAACLQNGLDEKHIRKHIQIITREQARWIMATEDRGVLTENTLHIDLLKQTIVEFGIDLLIIDPVISIHRLDESSPSQMDFLANIFVDIARDTGCVIVLVSHTIKSINKDNVGEASTARGSGSLVFATRRTFILSNPLPEDMVTNGMDPASENCKRYLRLHDAKQNYSEGQKTTWYFKQSLGLPSGEASPVCMPMEVKEEIAQRKTRIAQLVINMMQAEHSAGSMPLTLVIDRLRALDAIFAEMTKAAARSYMERTFGKGVMFNGVTAKITHVGAAVHIGLEGALAVTKENTGEFT